MYIIIKQTLQNNTLQSLTMHVESTMYWLSALSQNRQTMNHYKHCLCHPHRQYHPTDWWLFRRVTFGTMPSFFEHSFSCDSSRCCFIWTKYLLRQFAMSCLSIKILRFDRHRHLNPMLLTTARRRFSKRIFFFFFAFNYWQKLGVGGHLYLLYIEIVNLSKSSTHTTLREMRHLFFSGDCSRLLASLSFFFFFTVA
jgi:hypothetical protein